MRAVACSLAVVLLAGAAPEQAADPPLSNNRIAVSTLLREDIFAGWRENDMERYARGEKNIETLLEMRPKARPELLAWKGAAKLYRAILASEAGQPEEFERLYKETLDAFGEAKKLGPKHPAVAAIVGGTYVLFGDRLPEKHRAAAWNVGYENYQILWEQQSRGVERLPLHIRGELLAGVAQSAQRTGHTDECNQFLDKIIEMLPDTGYAQMAEKWKADPSSAATTNLSCKSCHNAGRLNERMAALEAK